VAKIPSEVREAFAQDLAAKFLATVDGEGVPNVAPVITTYPWDEETLIFGDFMLRKTRENLLRVKGPPVSAAVMTEDYKCFEVRGRFLGFETSGEKFDQISRVGLFRYSAIGLLRAVGTIAVEEVHTFRMGGLGLAWEWLTTRLAASRPKEAQPGTPIHPVVLEKVGVLRGAKFLALAREGRVEQFPVLCLQPAGRDYVAFRTKLVSHRRKALRPGEHVAISVFTMDPQAYQLKGEFAGYRRSRGFQLGLVRVTSVWTQTPPRPGERIVHSL